MGWVSLGIGGCGFQMRFLDALCHRIIYGEPERVIVQRFALGLNHTGFASQGRAGLLREGMAQGPLFHDGL